MNWGLKSKALLVGVIYLCSAAVASSITLSLRFDGTFLGTSGTGHQDISVGDTFSFTLTFDDSNVVLGSGGVSVSSIVSQELLVNGVFHTSRPVVGLGLITPHPAWPFGQMSGGSLGPGLDGILIDSINLPGPGSVGATAEFSDFLLFSTPQVAANGAFNIQGTDAGFMSTISANPTITLVSQIPEPSFGAYLVAILGAFLLQRRRSKNW